MTDDKKDVKKVKSKCDKWAAKSHLVIANHKRIHLAVSQPWPLCSVYSLIYELTSDGDNARPFIEQRTFNDYDEALNYYYAVKDMVIVNKSFFPRLFGHVRGPNGYADEIKRFYNSMDELRMSVAPKKQNQK